jgi:hypothetical protein
MNEQVIFGRLLSEFLNASDSTAVADSNKVLAPTPSVTAQLQQAYALTAKHIEYPLQQVRSANVLIEFAVGTNQLQALGDSDKLIEGDLLSTGEPTFEVTESGSEADIKLTASNSLYVVTQLQENWDVRLNTKVSHYFDLHLGGGTTTIDLGQFLVMGGRIDIGAASAEVRLPAFGKFTLTINGGVSNLRIIVPRGIAIRVEVSVGVGAFNPSSRLQSIGNDVYETKDFASAGSAVLLRVKMGAGTITIEDSD